MVVAIIVTSSYSYSYSWLQQPHLVTAAALLAVVIVDEVVLGGTGARLLQHPADPRHQLPDSQ